MAYGRVKVLPCGHVGEAVFGQYYACPICDRGAVPEHIDPEETLDLCPHCGSDSLKLLPKFHVSGSDMWFCNDCRQTHRR